MHNQRLQIHFVFCARVGASKTIIDMIIVLSKIDQHIKNSILLNSQSKVVYVAPMKHLVAVAEV
jgi:replicative superfamily II helicase